MKHNEWIEEDSLRASFKESLDKIDFRPPDEGFQGLVNFFINAIMETWLLAIEESHRSLDSVFKGLSVTEKYKHDRAFTDLEGEFRRRLYQLVIGNDEVFSEN